MVVLDPPRPRLGPLLAKGFLSLLVDPTTTLIVIALTPALAHDFHVGLDVAAWWVTGYLAVYVALMPLAGILGDRWGHDRVLLGGIVSFSAGTAVCMAATSFASFLIGRLIQGVGVASLLPMILAQVSRDVPASRQGRVLGILELAGGMSGLGTVGAGFLAVLWGWRAMFLVPFALAAGVIATTLISRVPTRIRARDLSAPTGLGGMRLRLPSLELFQHRLFRWSALGAGGVAFLVTTKTLIFPAYLSIIWQLGPSAVVMLILLNPVGLIAGNLGAGALVQRWTPLLVASTGTGVLLAMFSVLFLGIWQHNLALILLGFSGAAFGGGFTSVALVSAAVADLPNSAAGSGAGLFGFIRRLGTLVSAAVSLPVLETRLHESRSAAAFLEVVAVLVVIAALLLLAHLSFNRGTAILAASEAK